MTTHSMISWLQNIFFAIVQKALIFDLINGNLDQEIDLKMNQKGRFSCTYVKW